MSAEGVAKITDITEVQKLRDKISHLENQVKEAYAREDRHIEEINRKDFQLGAIRRSVGQKKFKELQKDVDDFPYHITRAVISYNGQLKEPDPIKWVVPGFIPREMCSMIFGKGGTGKSTLGIYLAMCAANGLDFLGMKTEKLNALYVDFELSENEFRRKCMYISNGTQHGRQGRERSLLESYRVWYVPDGQRFLQGARLDMHGREDKL